jgi:hypothetical protein
VDAWWTKRCSGRAVAGAEWVLWFGPEFDWRAVVSRCVPNVEFELQATVAMPDWLGSRFGFQLEEKDGVTEVRFHHAGWPEVSEHYRVASFCWAMYLRLLKRYVELGEVAPYEHRLDA